MAAPTEAIRSRREPVSGPGDHGTVRSPRSPCARSSGRWGARRHRGSGTGVLRRPRRLGRRRGHPPGQHRVAPRRRGWPCLCQHCRVRRRAPGGGARRAGGRSAGPRTAPVTDVRPARGAGSAGDPRRPTRGRRRASRAAPHSDMGTPGRHLRWRDATATLETGAGVTRHVRGAAPELSDDDVLVLFTSGTTGAAKMVPLTHANVAASVQGICGPTSCDPRTRRSQSCRCFMVTGCLRCCWPPWPAGDACCCRSGDGSRHTRSGTTCGR